MHKNYKTRAALKHFQHLGWSSLLICLLRFYTHFVIFLNFAWSIQVGAHHAAAEEAAYKFCRSTVL